jgi:transcriptional regulator with XRE-family HTH domain
MSLFSDRVNELRKSKCLSKSKMLKDLELNPNSFVNWEKRGTVPSAEIVSRISLYLGTTVEYLIGDSENPEPPQKEPTRQEIDKLIDEMSEEKREALLNLLKTL